MRKTSAGVAALVLAVTTAGSALLGGTALASVPSRADISVQGTETNNCYTIKNGKIVKDNSSCSASAKGSNGGGGGGQPGKEVNNCIPKSSCATSAKSTPGKTK